VLLIAFDGLLAFGFRGLIAGTNLDWFTLVLKQAS